MGLGEGSIRTAGAQTTFETTVLAGNVLVVFVEFLALGLSRVMSQARSGCWATHRRDDFPFRLAAHKTLRPEHSDSFRNRLFLAIRIPDVL